MAIGVILTWFLKTWLFVNSVWCLQRDAAIVNGNTCPVLSSAYILTCSATGTFSYLRWTRGSTNIATCPTTVCIPDELGYTGTVSGSTYTLNIASLQAEDATTWHCIFGSIDSTYQLNPVTAQPAGSLSATCVASDTGHDVSCTGLTNLGTPATTLSIKESGVSVASTSTNPTLTTTVQSAGGKTYTCSLSGQDPNCLPAEASVTCEEPTTTAPTTTPEGVNNADRKIFSLAFFPTWTDPATSQLRNYLYMYSDEAGSCSISYNDDQRRSSTVDLIPGQIMNKPLLDVTEMSNIGTGVEPKAVYVNCSVGITLHGFNKRHFLGVGAEPFLLIPDDHLSNKYIVSSVAGNAFIGIVAPTSDTKVSIFLRSTCSYTYEGRTYGNNDVLNVTLQWGEVFRLGKSTDQDSDKCDFGGTLIESENQVSVLSGALSFWNSFFDTGHLVRQVLPTPYFAETIIVPEASVRGFASTSIRIIAEQNDTKVNITSEQNAIKQVNNTIMILQSRVFYDFTASPESNIIIDSSASIMVTQTRHRKPQGGSYMTVPGVNLYDSSYLVKGFDTSINSIIYATVVTKTEETGDLLVDGVPPVQPQYVK